MANRHCSDGFQGRSAHIFKCLQPLAKAIKAERTLTYVKMLALTRLAHQLRQLSNVRRDPVRSSLESAAWPLIVTQDVYAPDGCVFVLAPFPKFGLRLMHAATTCGSICGRALAACFR
jgi:hypothetical protein